MSEVYLLCVNVIVLDIFASMKVFSANVTDGQ